MTTPVHPVIEAMARADAEFDGRPFDGLSRADRERYLSRSVGSLRALAACAPSERMEQALFEYVEANRYPGTPTHVGAMRAMLAQLVKEASK